MPKANLAGYDLGANRSIRVFVSSTFRDMQAERDVLIKKIFPQLRKMCEERLVTWTEVDLRWGITTEEASEGKVLPLCLAEIERCRPFFIGLLGERYGWVLKEHEFPQKLLENQPWLKAYNEHSVTELEILHGVLLDPEMATRSLFYFRDPTYIDKLQPVERQNFIDVSSDKRDKLRKLKDRIREAYRNGNLQYAPREDYPDPERVGEQVLADFTEILDHLFPKTEVSDPLDIEAFRHESYARNRRLAFFGRNELIRRLDDHVLSSCNHPLIITGDPGCGKTSLLAEWVALWRDKNPNDLVIQHYIGSTRESADWQGLVRRILGELKRSFEICDELPVQPEALYSAFQDWITKVAGGRRIVLVLDALNQLSTDDAMGYRLGWLPSVFPPNVCMLVSSIAGEGLDVLHQRKWAELFVPPFAEAEIAPAAMTFFKIFSKTPSNELLNKLRSAPAATNALYLRSVLDELRQFGNHEEVEAKATEYLAATDLPSLFDRILARWHDDFGKDMTYPDLVKNSLCLISCARYGLSESELFDLLGKEGQRLPGRFWTPFYLAAENALSQHAGLITFGHDYLRTAVQRRWLGNRDIDRVYQTKLATYFSIPVEPTNRKLDELPSLLRDMEHWKELKNLLADNSTLLRFRNHIRWKWELHGFWLALGQHYDPVQVYVQSLAAAEQYYPLEVLAGIMDMVATFHLDAGRYDAAEPLLRRALILHNKLLGPNHRNTGASMNNLATLLMFKGHYNDAEPLFRQALGADDQLLGPEHPRTLSSKVNLATLLIYKGNYPEAESLLHQAINIQEKVLGPDHPDTLNSMNNLAFMFLKTGDFSGAEPLFRHVLDVRERTIGPDHPDALTSVNNLADLLERKGDYDSAEILFRRALNCREKVLGTDHPDTISSINNLAYVLESKGDNNQAEPLYRRALAAREHILGPDHPHTLGSLNNLALQLEKKGKYEEAVSLLRRALETQERTLGPEHPDSLTSVNNLAFVLDRKGDSRSAEMLLRNALEVSERVLGPKHDNTRDILRYLARLVLKQGDIESAKLFLQRLDK